MTLDRMVVVPFWGREDYQLYWQGMQLIWSKIIIQIFEIIIKIIDKCWRLRHYQTSFLNMERTGQIGILMQG